ncbi:hypothetical protein B0T14DRAFT_571301 [Immersiella caudata]|uniref:Uncharacterized protein n=1 Tax=Immersiella caudata TaxID=314043 RepID=A0AA39U5D9_9PEZI|nr:hypothetical protein B0T14DRAFT_571301 [Immersiella caudata]
MADRQSQPDLEIPATAPVQRYRTSSDMHPAALYTLTDIPADEFNELQRLCESRTGVGHGKAVKLTPRARFIGEPLRAVFNYHPELDRQEEFDAIMFIVATGRNWRENGVLLVSLDAADPDDEECRTNMFRIQPEMSGGTVVGIQLGNTDGEESKETDWLTPEGEERARRG